MNIDCKDLIQGSPGVEGRWVVESSRWHKADLETITHAAIQKPLHYTGLPYVPCDIWRDPMAEKICETLGTNLIGLKLQDFEVGLWIITQPGLFEAEIKKVSPTFMKKVADELLADQRFVSLVDHAKITVPKTIETIKRLNRIGMAMLVALGGTFAYQSVADMLHHPAPPSILLIPAMIMGGFLGIRHGKSVQKEQRSQALAMLDHAAGKAVAKHWMAAALEQGFSREVLATSCCDERGFRRAMIDVLPTNRSRVEGLTYEAEDCAIRTPFRIDLLQVHAQPHRTDLGSTAVGMLVSSPERTSKPPDDRKSRRKKWLEWSKDWSWVSRPASAIPRPVPVPVR